MAISSAVPSGTEHLLWLRDPVVYGLITGLHHRLPFQRPSGTECALKNHKVVVLMKPLFSRSYFMLLSGSAAFHPA
ncbi:MAG: hypothetical protein ACAH88_10230, partial [Roseimicrobium sp.]